MMVSITSAELNFLVFRYLHESGFTHSAFAFGYEAGINNSTIDGNLVPPGALVKFIQKGIQLLELEANLNCNDADMDDDFSFIQPMDLITKGADEIQKIIREKKESLQSNKGKEKEKDREVKKGKEQEHAKEREKANQAKEMVEPEREQMELDRERDRNKNKDSEVVYEKKADVKVSEDKETALDEADEGPKPMDISSEPASEPWEIPSSDVTVLEGHASEVFACAWSPTGSVLASGSGDSTARIWTIADKTSPSMSAQSKLLNVVVLKHFKGRTNEKSKDVTTLDWNCDGTLLATGSYDGQARIWTKDGELKNTLNKHKGPVFSLKWNKKGDYLLSGSVDKTAIVWDVKTGEWKQQFEFHSAPTLDVDWRNNNVFATCSTDNMIYVCKIGENRPVKTFAGHQSEVNAIKWDPTGSLLASCSDDCTAKIWSSKQDKHVHDLKEHSKEIYTIRWSPTGPGTSNPNQQLILASASFDSTIKLWDVESGRLISSLNGHRDPVYSVAFSPNGEYLASGSLDKCVHIWSVRDGRVVKTFPGSGGIFEVCWNKEGDKIAACFANNVVCVLDVRK